MSETCKPIGLAAFDKHFFQGHTVRMIYLAGVSWMVLADVCKALGIKNPADVAKRLDDDEKGWTSTPTPGGDQSLTIVSEAGVYKLIGNSRKPHARAFQRWLFHDVLPALRQKGEFVFDKDPTPRPVPDASEVRRRLRELLSKQIVTDNGVHASGDPERAFDPLGVWMNAYDEITQRLRPFYRLVMLEIAMLRNPDEEKTTEFATQAKVRRRVPPIQALQDCTAFHGTCNNEDASFLSIQDMLQGYFDTFQGDTHQLIFYLESLMTDWMMCEQKSGGPVIQFNPILPRLFETGASLRWMRRIGYQFLGVCEANVVAIRQEIIRAMSGPTSGDPQKQIG